MLQSVLVRLRRPTRVARFLSKGVVLSRGDACIVRTEQGLEYGLCTETPQDCTEDEAKAYSQPVVRKATANDHLTLQQILKEEERAFGLCAGKIRERNLPMQLVDVEYTFDRHKITFRFTADDRVDFRDLVRELAHDLKARIELQHIQVRDKAKIVGGFAACGRELCCSTWLGDFMPISMKMAKRQNLSLNPAKISGQCGRLMCCLSYENTNYEDPKKKKAAAKQEEPAPEPVWDVPPEEDREVHEKKRLPEAEETALSEMEDNAVADFDDEAAGADEPPNSDTANAGEPGAKRRSRRRRRRRNN